MYGRYIADTSSSDLYVVLYGNRLILYDLDLVGDRLVSQGGRNLWFFNVSAIFNQTQGIILRSVINSSESS